MPTAYCTIADLSSKLDQADLIALAADDSNTTLEIDDSDVQTRLADEIEVASSKVRSMLIRQIPDIDSLVGSDSQMAIDVREWACTHVLMKLFIRRRHYSAATNPYMAEWEDAKKAMTNVAEARAAIGSDPVPAVTPTSTTEDSSPIYAKAASHGGGTTSSLMDKW